MNLWLIQTSVWWLFIYDSTWKHIGHAIGWPNEYPICKEKNIPLWYQMGVPRLNQQPLKKGNSISIIGILGNGILMNSTTQWDSNPGP